MYEMQGHVEALAVDPFFARPTKVELFKRVSFPADGDGASTSVIDHAGMAIINDVQRRRLVVEVKRWKVSLPRIADVDRRLVMAGFAGHKIRFQIAPMARPTGVTVIPTMTGVRLLCSNSR